MSRSWWDTLHINTKQNSVQRGITLIVFSRLGIIRRKPSDMLVHSNADVAARSMRFFVSNTYYMHNSFESAFVISPPILLIYSAVRKRKTGRARESLRKQHTHEKKNIAIKENNVLYNALYVRGIRPGKRFLRVFAVRPTHVAWKSRRRCGERANEPTGRVNRSTENRIGTQMRILPSFNDPFI